MRMINRLTGVALGIAALSYSAIANDHFVHSDNADAQWDGDSAFDIRAGEMIDERVMRDDVDYPDQDLGRPKSLAFEWSANGFIELDREFRWDGGITTQSYLSLAIPETDAFLLISSCSNGKVQNYIQMHSDDDALGGAKQFLVETDLSETMSYRADIVPMPEGDGGPDSVSPMVELAFDDPLFAALAAGNWAYFQMGSGDDAIKVRASLSGSSRAINAFLSGCQANAVTASVPSGAL